MEEPLELLQQKFHRANKAAMKLTFASRFGRKGSKVASAAPSSAPPTKIPSLSDLVPAIHTQESEGPPTPKRRGSRAATGRSLPVASLPTLSLPSLPRPRSRGARSFGSSDVDLNEAAPSPFAFETMQPPDSVADGVFNLSLLVDSCLTAATETVFDNFMCHYASAGVDDRARTVQL